MRTTETDRPVQLEYLFDVRLKYKEGEPPVSSAEGKVGEYLGSGDGSVNCPAISGTVHWTLFEATGEVVCESNLFGVIETSAGAQIKFDTMGFFRRSERDIPNRWITSAAVKFDTTDERYAWLNSMLGVWEGEFDLKTYSHHYRVYARLSQPVSEDLG